MTTTDGDGPEVGAIVRDRLWGGTHTGTVVRRDGRPVFVARHHHHSFVEDELDVDQVEIWPDAPEQLDHRCGGIGIVEADGTSQTPGLSELR